MPEYLTTQQAAELIQYSPATLETLRSRGGGPRFIKLSRRKVLYRRADLLAWMEDRLVENTAEGHALVEAAR